MCLNIKIVLDEGRRVPAPSVRPDIPDGHVLVAVIGCKHRHRHSDMVEAVCVGDPDEYCQTRAGNTCLFDAYLVPSSQRVLERRFIRMSYKNYKLRRQSLPKKGEPRSETSTAPSPLA